LVFFEKRSRRASVSFDSSRKVGKMWKVSAGVVFKASNE